MTPEASDRAPEDGPGRVPEHRAAGLRRYVPLLSAGASVAVAAALVTGYRGFHPLALVLVTAGALAAVAAAMLGRAPAPAPAPVGAVGVRPLLAAAVLAFTVSHVFVPPGMYLDPPQPVAFRILAAVAVAVAATYLLRPPAALARWRFPALVALFVAMAVVVVRASPFPFIDVWWYQQYAGSLIWQGRNPYTFLYPNIYGHGGLFGPGVLEQGKVASFPYPPVTFLLGAPVVTFLEDVRFLHIALAAAAALAAWRWRRSEAAELAMLVFLLQPRAFFVIEQAWTEPIVMVGLVATVLALLRWRARGRGWIAAGLAGALLLAAKQYAPLVALPFLPALPRGRRAVAAALAAGLAALTLVPFLAWDARELVRDVVLMQVSQPFRWDALSWLVPAARAAGQPVSAAFGFGAAALVLLLALRRESTVAHAARVAAAALLAFVLFNKQAFCNYYWLVVGLLAVSTSLGLEEGEGGTAP
jgi:hypothetical protein